MWQEVSRAADVTHQSWHLRTCSDALLYFPPALKLEKCPRPHGVHSAALGLSSYPSGHEMVGRGVGEGEGSTVGTGVVGEDEGREVGEKGAQSPASSCIVALVASSSIVFPSGHASHWVLSLKPS